MRGLLTALVASSVLIAGVAASAAYAEEGQAPAPQSQPNASPMPGNGMMNGQGGMMGGGQGGMMGSGANGDMMKQMSQMMETCNTMMQNHMQNTKNRSPKQKKTPDKG